MYILSNFSIYEFCKNYNKNLSLFLENRYFNKNVTVENDRVVLGEF